MTTSRQRKKQKTGSGGSARSKRATQKRIKRAPTIKGPAVIRDNWDPKATLRQNYRNLGLIGDLSLRDSGGAVHGLALTSAPARTMMISKGASRAKAGMAKVERDEEGNIISIEEPTSIRDSTAWGEALNSEDEDEEDDETGDDAPEEQTRSGTAAEVVTALESAASTIKPVQRYTSDNEHAWLQKLLSKHGDDVEAMARDRVDNVWQKTAGEIRRAIKKAGGAQALRSL